MYAPHQQRKLRERSIDQREREREIHEGVEITRGIQHQYIQYTEKRDAEKAITKGIKNPPSTGIYIERKAQIFELQLDQVRTRVLYTIGIESDEVEEGGLREQHMPYQIIIALRYSDSKGEQKQVYVCVRFPRKKKRMDFHFLYSI